MGHRGRIVVITWLLVVWVGCGESERSADEQAFMKEANPIVRDICELRFEQSCRTFDDTAEECRIEMLAAVGGSGAVQPERPSMRGDAVRLARLPSRAPM
jgi:hypothetical protein